MNTQNKNNPVEEVDIMAVFRKIGDFFGKSVLVAEQNFGIILVFSFLGLATHVTSVIIDRMNPTYKSEAVFESFAYKDAEIEVYFEVLNAAFKSNDADIFTHNNSDQFDGSELQGIDLKKIKGLNYSRLPIKDQESKAAREELLKQEALLMNDHSPKYKLELFLEDPEIVHDVEDLILSFFRSDKFQKENQQKIKFLKLKKNHLEKEIDLLTNRTDLKSSISLSENEFPVLFGEFMDVVGISKQSNTLYDELLITEKKIEHLINVGNTHLISPFISPVITEQSPRYLSAATLNATLLGFILGYIFVIYRRWKTGRNR